MNLLLLATIFGGTAIAMWRRRGHKISAPFAILTFGLVVSLGYGVIAYRVEQEHQHTRDACVQRAERSAGNRDQWLWLGNLLQTSLPKHPEIAVDLLKNLDANLPALNAADC
jgi:hypothetical protein